MKDYLRELPDPLCTSSLYQMLMDALCVQVHDDEIGNAQLMFSILDCLPTVNQVIKPLILVYTIAQLFKIHFPSSAVGLLTRVKIASD